MREEKRPFRFGSSEPTNSYLQTCAGTLNRRKKSSSC